MEGIAHGRFAAAGFHSLVAKITLAVVVASKSEGPLA